MSSRCDTTKKSLNSIESNDAKRREYSEFAGKNDNLSSSLRQEGILLGEVIKEGLADEHLDKLYGPKDERSKMAAKIYGLLDANEAIKPIMKNFILEHAPRGIKLGKRGEVPDLYNFGIKQLKLI